MTSNRFGDIPPPFPGRQREPDQRYAAHRAISLRELEARPLPPSHTIREIEAALIGELGRLAHMDDRRFDGWPSISIARDHDRWHPDLLDLRAEVKARPL